MSTRLAGCSALLVMVTFANLMSISGFTDAVCCLPHADSKNNSKQMNRYLHSPVHNTSPIEDCPLAMKATNRIWAIPTDGRPIQLSHENWQDLQACNLRSWTEADTASQDEEHPLFYIYI